MSVSILHQKLMYCISGLAYGTYCCYGDVRKQSDIYRRRFGNGSSLHKYNKYNELEFLKEEVQFGKHVWRGITWPYWVSRDFMYEAYLYINSPPHNMKESD